MKLNKIQAIIIFLFPLTVFNLNAQPRITPAEYIERYKELAMEDMDIYGIPASITLAQGLLESDCGNSRLAVEANNHFGIKCKSDWKGMTILHDDDAPQECFRKYSSAEESYRDHSEFLDKSARYQPLFELDIMDYKGWAHGLRQCGYATNPRYADLLIKVIEENSLYLYDVEWLNSDYAAAEALPDGPVVVEVPPTPIEETAEESQPEKIDVDNYMVSVRSVGAYHIYHNNGSEFVVARKGDTYEIMSPSVGVSSKKLRKFNDKAEGEQPAVGEAVYIKAKANRATNGKLIHIVKDGETMHSISQTYGIKLARLARMNNRGVDSRLSAGQQIRLM